METLTGTVLPQNLYGWYYRSSTHCYEQWWGNNLLLTVSAEILPVMPTMLSDEIHFGVAVKGAKGMLD